MNHHDHGRPMTPRCSMHMLWNTQIIDTCVVFPQWHIRSHTAFIVSLLAIVALGVLYEYLREVQKLVDVRIATAHARGRVRSRTPPPSSSARSSPDRHAEEAALLGARSLKSFGTTRIPVPSRLLRAFLYALTVALSFFLMLVFMTYNAYLILAVVVGAGIGHYTFGGVMNVDAVLSGVGLAGRSMTCH